MRIFRYGGPVAEFIDLLIDAMLVGLLWVLTSLAVVTVGASSSAAYYVMMRRVSHREYSIVKDYFTAFKGNFVSSALMFLTIAGACLVCVLNIYNLEAFESMGAVVLAFQVLLALEICFISVHAFPLISRFDMKFRDVIKLAAIIAHKHLLTTLAHVALLAAAVLSCFFVPFLFFVNYGIYCWMSSYMLIRVYRKYRPEMDMDEDGC